VYSFSSLANAAELVKLNTIIYITKGIKIGYSLFLEIDFALLG